MTVKVPIEPQGFVAEVDPNELICRMLDVTRAGPRPPGHSAQVLVDAMDPETRRVLRAMARAALEYFAEAVSRAQRVQ